MMFEWNSSKPQQLWVVKYIWVLHYKITTIFAWPGLNYAMSYYFIPGNAYLIISFVMSTLSEVAKKMYTVWNMHVAYSFHLCMVK